VETVGWGLTLRFLSSQRLPVEVRNPTVLSHRYHDILTAHGVAHVYNHWTYMPPLIQQHELMGRMFTAPFIVLRLLTPLRMKYEDAVKTARSYNRIVKPLPEMRAETVRLVRQAVGEQRRAYVLVNNRSEGSAPLTIRALGGYASALVRVLLIRGGGNELDLLAYDDYDVATAVARCLLLVVSGLGHTADQSICDVVSYKSLETPTAAARFLVDQIQILQDQLHRRQDRMRASALEHVHGCRRHLLSQRPQFTRHALSLVHHRQRTRGTRWHGLYTAAREYLHQQRRMLNERYQPMPLLAVNVVRTHRALITERCGVVLTGAPMMVSAHRSQLHIWRRTVPLTALTNLVGPARRYRDKLCQRIHYVGCEVFRRGISKLHRLHAHIQAASPDRYFALGLSYVTGPGGTVVRSRSHVSAGDPIEVHVIDGTISATVTRKE
jgi:exodeoxyribonuclease VII large subunit